MTTEIQSKPNDVYDRVTDKIIQSLERGELIWRKPWSSAHMQGRVQRPLRWNGIPYTGINTLLLWATAAEQGYVSPHWMTFKQAVSMKANVRKGEKATQIVYMDRFEKEETDSKGEKQTRKVPFLRSYAVFNAAQIEGLGAAFYAHPEPLAVESIPQRNAELERFFAQTQAEVVTGTKAAYYQNRDSIEMPPIYSFYEVSDYYATLAHELTHWTKHPTRLNRELGRQVYGDAGYAKEELVAELGACFLAADLGFAPKSLEQSAAYIQTWLRALKDDKRLIFSAASLAQRAVEYVHGLQEAKPV